MGATMGLSGEAGSAGLDFFTSTGALSDKAPWGDIQEVFYELKAPTDRNQAGMDLVRCVNRNLLATTTKTGHVIRDFITGLILRLLCHHIDNATRILNAV